MKISRVLYEKALPLWQEAAKKPFVLEMARGTLSEEKFKRYMLQDYLYLQDYAEILKRALKQAEEQKEGCAKDSGEDSCSTGPSLPDFLRGLIQVVEIETENVHLPAMRQMGITEEEISRAARLPAFAEYVTYMQRCLDKGIRSCLTALLQCSWNYAYLSAEVCAHLPEEVACSPYKSWFDAYTGRDYVEANQRWIDFLDAETEGIGEEEAEKLSQLFANCAIYENRLWDALYA